VLATTGFAIVLTMVSPPTGTASPLPQSTPFLAATAPLNWYGTYSIRDVGKKGVPKLNARQLRWLRRVEQWPGLQRPDLLLPDELRHPVLRFALPLPGVHVPLIVFNARTLNGWNPSVNPDFTLRAWIIGERCNTYFNPLQHQVVAATEAACTYIGTPPPTIPGGQPFLWQRK